MIEFVTTEIIPGWRRVTRTESVIMLLCVVMSSALTLLVSHAVIVWEDRAELQRYTDRLFNRSAEIADVTFRALDQAPPDDVPCSIADLDHLRKIALNTPLIGDIGRLEANGVVCTALWNIQKRQRQPLPRPDLVLNGLRFWTQRNNPASGDVVSDFVAKNDTFVVTSPMAFNGFEPLRGNISAEIVSANGEHVFRSFANTPDLHLSGGDSWYNFGTIRYVRRCEAAFPFCVVSIEKNSGLPSLSLLLKASLALLGCMVGVGLGATMISQRRHYFSMPERLRRALHGDGLEVHYQPLRTLDDRRLIGAEALARWRDADGNWISPETFVSLAEAMGIIGLLTRQVLKKALCEMAERLRTDDGFYLSVNITAADILDSDFREFLYREVSRYLIESSRVMLEITERSTADHGELSVHIRGLREKGFRIYIDDFGTGYSNLSSLAKLPIDAIKVDRMFVKALGTGSPVEAIVEPICNIAQNLNIRLIFEGIEIEHQLQAIQRITRNATGQGWLLGHPVPRDAFPVA